MKKLIVLVLVLLPLCLSAQGQEDADAPSLQKKERRSSNVFTGFSGGMMLHGGYLFSDNPKTVFSNTGLGSIDYVKGLPKAGLCYGFGGTLRIHLINHIHLGAEGHVSHLPLMNTGSNIRTGWGGAMCDFYGNWGKTRPMIGMSIGGGAMKRLYVPDNTPVTDTVSSTIYNSSYVKTPFFYLDPYIGMEIDLGNHMAILIRIDYMLPFNIQNTGLTQVGEKVTWGNFLTPSGPRLYIGLMFGKLKKT